MLVETVRATGPGAWVAGLVGRQSERFRRVTLTEADLAGLTVADAALTYDGDGGALRLALQAYALGIAYEFEPWFGVSLSRVDPLPHQLEAVYEHLLKQPRVRFLLADDAGALDLAKRADILPGLAQVRWDLVIVDEAHRMSARDQTHKSQLVSTSTPSSSRWKSANVLPSPTERRRHDQGRIDRVDSQS